jgi:quinol monooxygenase YgiN
MKNKPGFIAADLSPGVSDSGLWIEISTWEDISHLRAAFNDLEVQQRVQKLPRIRMSHIFIASGGGHATPDE